MGTYHLLYHLLGYRDWIIGLDGNLSSLSYHWLGYIETGSLAWMGTYHLYHLLDYRGLDY